ncbi:MAG: YkgJ family cysteine cluster protein [Actinobacteria bacterium]|nr:YkgJ family cysteine cluster protein [Actinomycetota bacterium]
MAKHNQKKASGGSGDASTGPIEPLPSRLRFPADEKQLPWLTALLDSYAIVDEGVVAEIRDRQESSGQRPACRKGCGNCCQYQKDVPLFPHELMGIYWYVSEKISKERRSRLEQRFAAHGPDSHCPFLLDAQCQIHPLRPMGCRQFNVFGKPCEPGEDPYYTRRGDVMIPLPRYTDRAFAAVFSFYRINEEDVDGAIGLIRAQMINLLDYNWPKLAAALSGLGED